MRIMCEILPGLIAESVERAARNLEPARIGWRHDRRSRAHLLPALHPPSGQNARRPVRPADRSGQHAPWLPEPRRDRSIRPGRPRADRSVRPVAAAAARSPCWPTTRCTTSERNRFRPTTTAGLPPHSRADQRPGARAAVCRHHVARHQRRPDVDELWQRRRRIRAWMRTPRTWPGVAHQAYQSITYHDWVPLAMAETTLVLVRRTPDPKRLAWAKAIVDQMKAQAKTKEQASRAAKPGPGLRPGGDLSS